MRAGHVSYWPAYHERKPRERTPVALVPSGQRWEILLADQTKVTVGSHAEIVSLALDEGWDVYVSRFGPSGDGYPYIQEAKDDPRTTIAVLPGQGIVGITSKRKGSGNLTAWIGQARSWGFNGAGPGFLTALIDLQRLFAVGAQPTPSRLGQAVMRSLHAQIRHPLVSRPSLPLRRDLFRGLIGGRVDYNVDDEAYPTVYELDMRNAYASVCTEDLPIGTAHAIPLGFGGRADDYPAWYCRCRVFLPTDTAFMPVSYRLPSGLIHHATEAGWHGTEGQTPIWLWRQEAVQARQMGAVVEPLEGWAWPQTAPILREWALVMHGFRQMATGIQRDMIKACTVAGIGRFGMRPEKYRLVRDGEQSANAVPLIDQAIGAITDYWIETTPDPDANHLTHWYSHVLASCRVKLCERAHAETVADNTVLATNYDAIYLAYPSALPLNPDELGGWRQTVHHKVRMPHPRWILSDLVTKTPGQTHKREAVA